MAPLLQAMALALRASAPICPAAPTCPQDDQCVYSSNSVTLKVSCATDFYGGDLQLVSSASLEGCLQACAANTQCVAVSYTGENCYLKSTLESAQTNSNVIGGAVMSRPTVTVSSTVTASSIVTASSTVSAGSTTSTAVVASAVPTACPATYTCPENNGCTITGSNSMTYIVTCGVDYYGGDLPNVASNSFEDCTKACASNSQCVAASYVGGKNAGTCYLKSSNNGATTNGNVDSIALYTPVANPSSSVASPSVAAPTSSLVSSTAVSSSTTTVRVSSSLPASSSSALSSSTSTSARSSSTPAPSSTAAPTPSQVIVNGGFEGADLSPWTFGGLGYSTTGTGRSTVNPRSGKYSFQAQGALFSITPFTLTLSQTVTVVPGKAYNFSLSTKQTLPTCVFSGFYNEVLFFSNVKFTDGNYATTSAQISSFATTSKSGVLRISATGCVGTSLWLDDISLTQV